MKDKSQQLTTVSKPLRRRGIVRRTAIIKAAAELFLVQSYERTTLDQIVERAGGSKTLVYEQFGDKEGLFKAVMLDLCENIFRPVERPRRTGKTGPKEPRAILIELGLQFLHTIWGNEVLALSRIVFTEGSRHPEVADVFFTHGYDEGFKRLAGYLDSISRSRLAESRRMQLSMIFFCMMKGDAFDRKLAGSNHQRSLRELVEQVEMATDWLLQQLS